MPDRFRTPTRRSGAADYLKHDIDRRLGDRCQNEGYDMELG
jgi:hypothetical protein